MKGFVKISRDIFCLHSETVESLRSEFERLFQGEYETGIYPDEIHWRSGISKETATRELCNAWKASLMIRKVVCDPKLGALACTLMNWKATRIGQDDVIHKPSQSTPVGFHQDGTYISDNFVPRQGNCLTMWMALDDADSENGALQYAPGSHQWQYQAVENVSASSFHVATESQSKEVDNLYLQPLRQAALEAGKDPETVLASLETVSVQAGDLIVHHQNVWHGSGPNTSKSRLRRALVAHLINGKVQWRTKPTKPHYIYGRYYIRGETNLRDDFFPVTYSVNDDLTRTRWLDNDNEEDSSKES